MQRLALLLLAILAGCQYTPPPEALDSGANGAAERPEDWLILDAALGDMLANPALADSRTFYGSGGTRVLYNPETFPPGYIPAVPGFQFEAQATRENVPHIAPLALAVDLRWFRGKPMLPQKPDRFDSNQAYRDRHGVWDGIEFCIFNGGGGGPKRKFPIGGCSVYYDVRTDRAKWSISWKGAEDP